MRLYPRLNSVWKLTVGLCFFTLSVGFCSASAAGSSDKLLVKLSDTTAGNSVSVIAGTVIEPMVIFASTNTAVESGRVRFSLDPAQDSIGYFDGTKFIATRVGSGAIVGEVDGVSGISATITVQPGQLSEILLSISADQVVGNPLIGTAKLVLLDEFNNLLIHYDLAAQPITLVCDTGFLSPSLVSDTLLMDSGVIDFVPLGTTYTGPSVRAGIYATNGTVNSNNVIVSFNGYDVHRANDIRGETVSIVYSGLPTIVNAIVSNGGDQLADSSPQLKAYFKSGGGSVKVYFPPLASAQSDTILIHLPTDSLAAGADTLVLELDSKYLIGGSLIPTVSYQLFPVTVHSPVSVSLVSGTMRPDSVYADVGFSASFDARITGLAGQVDSSVVELSLANAVNGSAVAPLFSGLLSPAVIGDSILRFTGIGSIVSGASVTIGTTYVFRAGLMVYSGGNVFTLDSAYDGHLLIIGPSGIDVDTGSVVPSYVTERDEKPFAFDIVVSGSRIILVDPNSTNFRVQGGGYSSSTAVTISSSQLYPGVNHVTTGNFIFPSIAAGHELSLNVSFSYRVAGADNARLFSSTFNGKTVFVRPRPVVTVVSTKAFSPNTPHVNTGQNFTLECAVTTTAEVDNLGIRLKTEGHSTFLAERVISHMFADDTATVSFSVIADTTPTAAEVFTVDVVSGDVNTSPALDNVEVITIERPARLVLSHSLVGTVNNVVSPRSSFGLNVRLINSGDAPITPGVFTLTAGGVPVGIVDPLTDTIDDRSPIGYELTAPERDTTIHLNLQFTRLPLDRNTGLQAVIDATGFESTVFVSKLDAHLQVEVDQLSSGVAVGGGVKDLATFRLALAGTSTLSGIQVTDIGITVADFDGNPVDARDLFVVGGTGVYQHDRKLSVTTAGGNMVKFFFQNLTVSAVHPPELTLRVEFQKKLPHGIRVFMRAEDIHAIYSSGPVAGQPIQVIGPGGSELVFEIPLEITGPTMSSSFVVRDNPYNPDSGPAEFRYLPTDPSGVNLKILSLDGQLVYEREYRIDLTSNAGDPFVAIYWDGRNDAGDIVRNGVYLVVLIGLKTQEQAVTKLAVIR